MAFNPSKNNKRLAEINVTPLVDVMLVLMIIFLVTAPLMKYSVNIDIPKTTETNLKKYNEPTSLIIDKKGQIYWNDEAITFENFNNKLNNFKDDDILQIVADKETQYQYIAKILVKIKSKNINNIGFVIEEEK